MNPSEQVSSAIDNGRAYARGVDWNCRLLRGIEEARARNKKSFKTNPIIPSLPNPAARCAFARSGAQRAPDQKSAECRIFSRSVSVRPRRREVSVAAFEIDRSKRSQHSPKPLS